VVVLTAAVVALWAGPASADPPVEFQTRVIAVVQNCDELVALGGPSLPQAPDFTHTFWADITVRAKPWRQDPNAIPGETGTVYSIDGTGVDAAGQDFKIDAKLYRTRTLPLDFKGSGSMTVTRDDGSRASGTGRWAEPIVDGGPVDTLRLTADSCRVK
jgi:hypothetical protein